MIENKIFDDFFQWQSPMNPIKLFGHITYKITWFYCYITLNSVQFSYTHQITTTIAAKKVSVV